MSFLPINRQEMLERGWQQCDFVYVIGDAYVDHHSFGHAIISRILESHGYSVGIISQPDWKNPKSIDIFGRPRLGFLVSGGNMDSMVNHYSVTKHKRKTDAFTPGGVMGKRPDYATIVYCNLIRQTYKDVPILIGGIEASLRRLAHYDYWSESMKRSILLDSQADLLMYGMGEKSIVELADADELYKNTLHPYTQALLSAVPIPIYNAKKDRIILTGDVPSPMNPPSGCPFHPRCTKCQEICKQKKPTLNVVSENGHAVACHLYDAKE